MRKPALIDAADAAPSVRHPRDTRVVRVRFTLADRAGLDRLRARYAAEHGCKLTRMGAARALMRRGLAGADDRPLSDVLGDVEPDGVCRRPTSGGPSSDGNAAR